RVVSSVECDRNVQFEKPVEKWIGRSATYVQIENCRRNVAKVVRNLAKPQIWSSHFKTGFLGDNREIFGDSTSSSTIKSLRRGMLPPPSPHAYKRFSSRVGCGLKTPVFLAR